MDVDERMKADWDKRAVDQKEAMRYIIDRYDGTAYDFYRSGITHVGDLLHALIGFGGFSGLAGKTAIEVGCGIGRLSVHLAPLFFDGQYGWYYALDVSQRMIDLCPDLKGMTRICTPSLLAVKEPVDYIFSHIVFQHMPKSAFWRYLDEAYQVLRPGGVFHAQMHETAVPVDYNDSETLMVRGYTPEELACGIPNSRWEVLAILREDGVSEKWKWLTLRKKGKE